MDDIRVIDNPAHREQVQSCLDDILAVLVIYEKQVSQSESFVSLTRGLQKMGCTMDLFIYDNSPTPMFAEEQGKHMNWRISYVHDETNPGISRAFNEGFRRAGGLGKKWLLLLDQDTFFPPDALAEYCRSLQACQDIALFSPVLVQDGKIYSPCRYFAGTGLHLNRVTRGRQKVEGISVLSSGMLIRCDVFGGLSGFNEKIKLDFADFDFVNRYRMSFEEICVINAECAHSFSNIANSDLDSSLRRFGYYCQGARNAIVKLSEIPAYSAVVLLRCLVLCMRFRTGKFVAAYFRQYVLGRDR